MHPVAEAVRRTIARFNLIPAGSRVLVALSGGSDSVALVHLLRELAPVLRFDLAGLAHLNHGLRGEAADEDERFCRDLAAALGLPADVERADVAALAASAGRSVEDAGHEARDAFFRRAAARARAGRVAVGHTRDDQAETFLLRLLRGAGARGLAGIHPQRGPVVRPLLEQRRSILREYLQEIGASWREDATNDDVTIPRNRVRRELIPYLAREFSPGIVDVLAREASIARAEADYLDTCAAAARGRLAAPGADGAIELDVAAWLAEPPAVGWRLTRQLLHEVSGGRFIGYDHVLTVVDLASSESPVSRAELPGVVVTRFEGRLRFARSGRSARRVAGRRAERHEWNAIGVPLSIPGEAALEGRTGATIVAEVAAWPTPGLTLADGKLDLPPEVAVLDRARVPASLEVRRRRPGDRLTPLGLAGRKKLHDYFVDRKVARAARDHVPIVAGERGGPIVWVAGHGIAEDFRVTGQTEAVVILKLVDWSDRA